MFRLNTDEFTLVRSQSVTAYKGTEVLSAQSGMLNKKKRNTNVNPYAFTEQGVAMLSSVLHSDRAVNMNIAIMRAFVEVRQILLEKTDAREQLKLIQERIAEHDIQLSYTIYTLNLVQKSSWV